MGKAETVQTARICKVSRKVTKVNKKITFVWGLEPRTTLREGVVEGLARALGRPIQPAGSWLARNPVGAWVGRCQHIIIGLAGLNTLYASLFGFQVERREAGWRLVALP